MSESSAEIRDRLRSMMADLFRCDASDITASTGPGDVDGWDSLGHVSLMSEIESKLGMHVPVEDALEVTSFDDLVDVIVELSSESNA